MSDRGNWRRNGYNTRYRYLDKVFSARNGYLPTYTVWRRKIFASLSQQHSRYKRISCRSRPLKDLEPSRSFRKRIRKRSFETGWEEKLVTSILISSWCYISTMTTSTIFCVINNTILAIPPFSRRLSHISQKYRTYCQIFCPTNVHRTRSNCVAAHKRITHIVLVISSINFLCVKSINKLPLNWN